MIACHISHHLMSLRHHHALDSICIWHHDTKIHYTISLYRLQLRHKTCQLSEYNAISACQNVDAIHYIYQINVECSAKSQSDSTNHVLCTINVLLFTSTCTQTQSDDAAYIAPEWDQSDNCQVSMGSFTNFKLFGSKFRFKNMFF